MIEAAVETENDDLVHVQSRSVESEADLETENDVTFENLETIKREEVEAEVHVTSEIDVTEVVHENGRNEIANGRERIRSQKREKNKVIVDLLIANLLYLIHFFRRNQPRIAAKRR